ncbi:hypothetical protein [Paenibacillus lutimineralis]|nr:hypothetical protein [Paenibacillus lutimineralis]
MNMTSKKATSLGRFSDGMNGGEPWLFKATIRRCAIEIVLEGDLGIVG